MLLRGFDFKQISFVIFHEVAHYKRIYKFGKDKLIEKLSIENFDNFFNFILCEELIADRYAMYVYYKLKKESFPLELTQNLHLEYNINRYRYVAVDFFDKVKNNEENYKKLMESFII